MGSCRRVRGAADILFASSNRRRLGTGDQGQRRRPRFPLEPDLAVDRQGNAYAAWVDYRDGDAAIYAATRPVGGEWGKNARVSSGAANGYTGLTIIVDWEGTARVSWEGLDRCGGEASMDGSE